MDAMSFHKKEAGSFAIFVPEGKAERHHQAAFSQRAGRSVRVSNLSLIYFNCRQKTLEIWNLFTKETKVQKLL